MDPDETLHRIRRLYAPEGAVTDPNGDELSELVQTLDEWLSRGGFLPAAWRPTRDDDYSAEAIDRTNEEGE